MPYVYPDDGKKFTFGQLTMDCVVPMRTRGGEPLLFARTPELPNHTCTNFSFGVQQDCIAALDAARADKPNRAMLSGARGKDRVVQRMEFELVVAAGLPLSKFRWEYRNGVLVPNQVEAYCVVAQRNTWNDVLRTGNAPPTEIGLKQIGNDLCLSMAVHTVDPAGKKPWIDIQGPRIPILRAARSYRIATETLDLHGEPGGFYRVWLDGKLVWNYEGPVGHVGHSGSWGSFGAYRSNAPEELRLRISRYREGPVGALKASW